MRLLIASLAVCGAALFAAPLSAQVARNPNPNQAAPRLAIGTVVPDFIVHNDNGPVTIKPADAKATVVIFVSSRCPISMEYNARMNQLYKDYNGKNVQFAFASANVNESPEEIAKLRETEKLEFAVYKDQDNKLADRLGAYVTPEVFMFDSAGVLRYRGLIDDDTDASQVKTHILRNALDATLTGGKITEAETKAVGCWIRRKKA